MISNHDISKMIKVDPATIKAIYAYGSVVYGTANENSDQDFIVVLNELPTSQDIVFQDNINLLLHSIETFENSLADHSPSALECIFLPTAYRQEVAGFSPKFKLDKPKLRESFSQKASNSFVKAKKKFEVEKDRDFYIGKKSLFHSLRILKFGTQLGTTGKISDYACANDFWLDIFTDPSTDWATYKEKWQPIYNQLCTEFRLVAPKKQ